MYAYISGKLHYKEATYAIIETNGIGYHINISLQTYTSIKNEEQCKLFTYLHVREDILALYGFHTIAEKNVFLSLISVSGVGANTALVILSSLSADELRQAILKEDAKTIQQIKGIGAKSAQRIILELKDKIAKTIGDQDITDIMSTSPHTIVKEEALTALVTLGIAKATAEKTIEKILKTEGTDLSLEDIIKRALKTT